MSVESLMKQRNEWEVAPLLARVLDGHDTELGHRILLKKANVSITKDDPAFLKTDFNILADGGHVGFLDPEHKDGWFSGPWPYPKINIAIHPMSHWKRGYFTDRETNKLKSFREKPDLSWAFLYRDDNAAAMMVLARDIFRHGIRVEQKTKYSSLKVPVFEVPNRYGICVSSAEEVADVIEGRWNDLLG